MEIQEAKRTFISLWGNFGTQWGINRSMAQVHALLLSSEVALSTEEVMDELKISRGNANMNLRDLLNWNLVYKKSVPGDRKEYFFAEKDMWEVAKRIVKERKRREIEPLIQHLNEIRNGLGKTSDSEKEFAKTIEGINQMVSRLNSLSDTLLKADEHAFFGMFMKYLKK
ncbi:MAG: transcriptional regulator [Crocinitomicaceae bacterium]|jgi:DNA-binding transcriptional regulator GbsR (MarR family)|nr:transcriptional regulator [Crocinitomicaceae bacterium]